MKRKLIAFLLLAGIPASGFPDVEMPVSGKRGEGMAEVIRVWGAPRRLAAPDELTFTSTDHFGGCEVSVEAGRLPAGYQNSGLVCPEWWSELDTYGDTVTRDLANWFPASADVMRHRADLPPGVVTTAKFETPLWSAGTGFLGAIEAGFYSPPESIRGRLARAYFYMAVMYPQPAMRPKAYTMFSGDTYPALTAYAVEMLLGWHRAYPPAEEEFGLNRLMTRLQGNENPFVSHPEYAEYLWGDKAGEVYGQPGEPVPLHSRYRLSDTIHLSTPSAPADASWSIDGRAVKGTSVDAAAIGRGHHDVMFTSKSTGLTGRVMIIIEP